MRSAIRYVSPPRVSHGKRSDDFWHVDVIFTNGSRSRRTLGMKVWEKRSTPPDGYGRRQEADAAAQRVREGRHPLFRYPAIGLEHASLLDACDRYINLCVTKGRKARTLKGYRAENEMICNRFGASTALSQIRASDIETWQSELAAQGKSPRTINKKIKHLQTLYEVAIRFDLTDRNPVKAVSRVTETRKSSLDVYTLEELERLAEHAKSADDGFLFLFAAFTGLRLGEIRALRWRDISLGNRSIYVRRSFSGVVEEAPKSNRERRVPMSHDVYDLLLDRKRRTRHNSDDDLVFCYEDGQRLGYTYIRKRYIGAQKGAGLPLRRFHDLRHTFGSILIRKTDLVTLKEYMGHSTIQTTERYLHFRPQTDEAAIVSEAFTAASPEVVVRNSDVTDDQGRSGHSPEGLKRSGKADGPGRTRTFDLRIMSPLL